MAGIIDLSQLETGTFRHRPIELRPQGPVAEVVEQLRRDAERKGLSLSMEIDERDATALFDRDALAKVLFHLVDNAVKFTTTGGASVRLFRRGDGRLAIAVRDTGIGIGEDYLPKLFEPFSQEESGYTRSFEGPGVGLAIAKRLVDLNGGSLGAESARGAGSTFTILLPEEVEGAARDEERRHRDAEREPADRSAPPRRPHHQGRTS